MKSGDSRKGRRGAVVQKGSRDQNRWLCWNTNCSQHLCFWWTVTAPLVDRCCGRVLVLHCLSTFDLKEPWVLHWLIDAVGVSSLCIASVLFLLFSSRWCLSAQKSSLRTSPHLPVVSPNVAMETLPTVRLTDNGPPSAFQGRDHLAFPLF